MSLSFYRDFVLYLCQLFSLSGTGTEDFVWYFGSTRRGLLSSILRIKSPKNFIWVFFPYSVSLWFFLDFPSFIFIKKTQECSRNDPMDTFFFFFFSVYLSLFFHMFKMIVHISISSVRDSYSEFPSRSIDFKNMVELQCLPYPLSILYPPSLLLSVPLVFV